MKLSVAFAAHCQFLALVADVCVSLSGYQQIFVNSIAAKWSTWH